MHSGDALRQYEASSYLINMTSFDGIVRTGMALGLDASTTVLDLCCGYGEMLRIWSEAFGISGTGVDICGEFIRTGRSRLAESGIKDVSLIEGDVLRFTTADKYDVVCCTERFGSIAETLAMLERYVKPGGKLVFCHVFSKVPDPPKELTDFDGPLPTLDELYTAFRELGFYLTSVVSDTTSEWDRYISWSARRDTERLRQSRDDEALAGWIGKWWHVYFNYRRPCEGQALFVLERL